MTDYDALEHMAQSHDALVAEIKTLRKERDEERKNFLRACYERDEAIREIGVEGRNRGKAEAERDEAWQKYVDANEARIDALALLREAGEALEVFAANADTYTDDAPWSLPVTEYLSRFRRARECRKKIMEKVRE